uniref:Pyridine nucleotide-disulfide oxidoreductase domain-containing protein 2 n=1 Tax=Terrapene triunguis TaxID=2587831 RepID=A0A674HZ42_9SAUR
MAARHGLGRAWAGCSLQGRRLAHAGARRQLQREYDAVVIGGGHNGLVAAAYLQKSGVRTAVLERRHLLGGAAVTEEIVPGFKFSRASYLLSLLRPRISTELELQRHGLRVYTRDPYSFTPVLEDGQAWRSLLLGHDMVETQRQIAQFSSKDAQAYPKYEAFLSRLVSALDPLLDAAPVDPAAWSQGPLLQRLRALRGLQPLLRAGLALGKQLPQYYQVLTAPITRILDLWFESEPLKATLATDAVIGAMASPHTPGSGYVLLHHVMGELEGRKGAWGYVAGGMGGVSQAIAGAAAAHGADIFTEKPVARVLLGLRGEAQGVVLQDGTEVKSKLVLSNASAQLTFLQLVPPEQVPEEFLQHVAQLDTRSPVTKINGKCQWGTSHSLPHRGPLGQWDTVGACEMLLPWEEGAVMGLCEAPCCSLSPEGKPAFSCTTPSVSAVLPVSLGSAICPGPSGCQEHGRLLCPSDSPPLRHPQWLWIGCPASWLRPTPVLAARCPITSAPST